MNLKEGFRYQKFLNSIINDALIDINSTEVSVNMQNIHHMPPSVAQPVADVVETISNTQDYTADNILSFLTMLINEKIALGEAIYKAKKESSLDIDGIIEVNKQRQRIHQSLTRLIDTSGKEKKTQITGTGYTFDVNGVETPYHYPIDVIKTPAYNVKSSKTIAKGMIQQADIMSELVDQVLVNTQIEYKPPFDVNDTYTDAIETFLTLK